ncbi:MULTISPECIES: hypothetical protein [Bacteroides]|uniref:hypothetical protein n=1 Tax=Bacteroides TaxID=816 RepID=UPI0016050FC6|nr:hypothetical protein [Bacteroides acidifaciens]
MDIPDIQNSVTFLRIRTFFLYLMNYIGKKGVMVPKALNQWKIVPEEWAVPAAKHNSEYLFWVVNK